MRRTMVPISFLLIVGLAAPVRAQKATAYGAVTELGRPIVGAPVIIDDGLPIFTNHDGRYVAKLGPGQHQFNVALDGYRDNNRVVTLEKGESKVADFALDPVLQIAWLTVPASLKPGTTGVAQLLLRNTGPSPYSLDQVALNVWGPGGEDLRSEFSILPDAANPKTAPPGETVPLSFTLAPLRSPTLPGSPAPGTGAGPLSGFGQTRAAELQPHTVEGRSRRGPAPPGSTTSRSLSGRWTGA